MVFGPQDELAPVLGPSAPGVEIVDARDAISNLEDPIQAARAKPDASIVRAAHALGQGEVDAVVTPGSTGAALAAGLIHVKRLRGVHRPALAAVLPIPGRRLLLLDAGANAEVRPEHLVQFAFMGAALSERVLGAERPRVGLLSVGEEAGKGTENVVAAHERLTALGAELPFEFAGNAEGFDLASGRFDVVVTDGFTGNVALKTLEGTARTVVGAIRDAIRSGTISKLGGILIRRRLAPLRETFSPDSVGGAYLLGLRGLVVVCHGDSSSRTLARAIALADRGAEERVIERTSDALRMAGVARGDADGRRDAADPASVAADSVSGH